MNRALLILCVLCSPCLALKEYYSLSRSVRSLGMGGAFYGLSDDEYALFYNPAGLSLYRGEWQAMLDVSAHVAPATLSAVSTLKTATNQSALMIADELSQFAGRPLYAGVGLFPHYLRKRFAAGLLVADTKLDLAILGREFNTDFDVTLISDSGLFAGYAQPWLDENLHFGATAKLVNRLGGKRRYAILDLARGNKFQPDPKSLGGKGAGIDLDLGVTYDLPKPPVGLVMRLSLVLSNLLASGLPMSREGTPPGLPRMISLGGYLVLPGWWLVDQTHLLLDLAELQIGGEPDSDDGARTGGFFKHVNFGAELPIKRFLVFRGGFHQGNFTLGCGVITPIVKLDFATYGEEVFNGVGRVTSRRLALTLSLGIGNPPPPPLSAVRAVGSAPVTPRVPAALPKAKASTGKGPRK